MAIQNNPLYSQYMMMVQIDLQDDGHINASPIASLQQSSMLQTPQSFTPALGTMFGSNSLGAFGAQPGSLLGVQPQLFAGAGQPWMGQQLPATMPMAQSLPFAQPQGLDSILGMVMNMLQGMMHMMTQYQQPPVQQPPVYEYPPVQPSPIYPQPQPQPQREVMNGDAKDNTVAIDNGRYVQVNGRNGNDTTRIQGVHSDVVANGGDGNDRTIVSGYDNTVRIVGGEGNDTATIGGALNRTTGNLGNGNDRATLGGNYNTSTIDTGLGDDIAVSGGVYNTNRIVTGDGRDQVTINGHHNQTNVSTGVDNDTITVAGRDNLNRIHTGTGNDTATITSTNSETRLTMDAGADRLTVDGKGNRVSANTGDDADAVDIKGEGNRSSVNLGTGNDRAIVRGTEQTASLNGGTGNDHFYVATTANKAYETDKPWLNTIRIDGGEGNDILSLQGNANQWNSRTDEKGNTIYTNRHTNTRVVAQGIERVDYVNGGQVARIWGDPHFKDFDNKDPNSTTSYDFQGEVGKTYNIISDKGMQFNAEFGAYSEGPKGVATIMSKAGFTLADKEGAKPDQVQFNAGGDLLINGEVKGDGTYQLNNGTVVRNGNSVSIDTEEYEIKLTNIPGAIPYLNHDVTVKADGQVFEAAGVDGTRSHGILGQTNDGDGQARVGDRGQGAQGGGAIETIDATTGQVRMTQRGETAHARLYEVGSLFDTQFTHFNRFNG